MKKARLILEFGLAIYNAIKEGRTQETVYDVLPGRLRAEAHLLELDARAKRDYDR